MLHETSFDDFNNNKKKIINKRKKGGRFIIEIIETRLYYSRSENDGQCNPEVDVIRFEDIYESGQRIYLYVV